MGEAWAAWRDALFAGSPLITHARASGQVQIARRSAPPIVHAECNVLSIAGALREVLQSDRKKIRERRERGRAVDQREVRSGGPHTQVYRTSQGEGSSRHGGAGRDSCALRLMGIGVHRAYGILLACSVVSVVLGLGSNVLQARVFGASGVKDALEASLAIPRYVVLTFGLGSSRGSLVYVLGRVWTTSAEEARKYVATVLQVQLVYCSAWFVFVLLARKHFVKCMFHGMGQDEQKLVETILPYTVFIVLLQPLATGLASAATALKRFGTLPLTHILEKVSIVLGLSVVGLYGAQCYPLASVIGLGMAVTVLGIVFKWASLVRRGRT